MMSMGTMGSAPPSAAPSELSILRALARLLDPDADEAIAAVAAAQPRDDVRRAVDEEPLRALRFRRQLPRASAALRRCVRMPALLC
jgi:hypothetical protein